MESFYVVFQDCLSTSKACEGVCKEGFFSCGDGCKQDTEHNRRYYRSCGKECITESEQCNGSCPAHRSLPCGDTTCYPQDSYYSRTYRTCRADCIRDSTQCHGSCPPHKSVMCGKTTCYPNDTSQSYRTCGDRCLHRTTSCNGTCPEDLLLCGEQCVTNTSSSQCDPSCSAGSMKCGTEGACRVNSYYNQERCGEACFVYNQTTGALRTAQYPSLYLNSQNCVLDISAPDGYQVLVSVLDYEFEQGPDYVSFYEGLSTGDRSIIGSSRQDNILVPMASVSNNIHVTLKTDGSVVRKGFNATVQFVKAHHQCDTEGPCVPSCPPGFVLCNNHCLLNNTKTCPEPCLTFNTTTMTISTKNFPGTCC